jgi:hypothetical protein
VTSKSAGWKPRRTRGVETAAGSALDVARTRTLVVLVAVVCSRARARVGPVASTTPRWAALLGGWHCLLPATGLWAGPEEDDSALHTTHAHLHYCAVSGGEADGDWAGIGKPLRLPARGGTSRSGGCLLENWQAFASTRFLSLCHHGSQLGLIQREPQRSVARPHTGQDTHPGFRASFRTSELAKRDFRECATLAPRATRHLCCKAQDSRSHFSTASWLVVLEFLSRGATTARSRVMEPRWRHVSWLQGAPVSPLDRTLGWWQCPTIRAWYDGKELVGPALRWSEVAPRVQRC